MDIDRDKRQAAIDRFVSVLGVDQSEAARLVDAALSGIVDQALETISGYGPVPTAMGDLKADQVRYACLRAGRMLKQKEVEVLFRVKPSTARNILSGLRAVYGGLLRDQTLAEMQSDATIIGGGSAETELTWVVKFSERATYDAALAELGRNGLLAVTDERPIQRTIEVPRVVRRGSRKVKPLEILGIEPPVR
jgi:hypothetical protein